MHGITDQEGGTKCHRDQMGTGGFLKPERGSFASARRPTQDVSL